MQTIPPEVLTLLKSKQMVGPNRPTADFYVVGQPSTGDLTDPNIWTTWRTFISKKYGNMTETNDGRAIISYIQGNSAYIAYADSVAEVLAGTKTFGPGILINDDVPYGHTSLQMIDGRLRMVLSRWNADALKLSCHYWCDVDGNGNGFAYVSAICLDMKKDSAWYSDPSVGYTGPIQKISDNCWVVMVYRHTWIYSKNQLFYSVDKGHSWNEGPETPGWLGAHMSGAGYCFLPIDETSFWGAWWASDGSVLALLYTNSGATMTSYSWLNWPGLAPRQVAFIQIGNVRYMAHNTMAANKDILRFIPEELTPENFVDYDNWELIASVPDDSAGEVLPLFTLTNSALILQHNRGDIISGAGTDVLKIKIPIKSIVVNRSKGAASRAMVVIDNALGMYSPDSVGRWAKVLWFNKKIIIRAGYGSELQHIFTGLIDGIYMSNYPAELTVSSRDYSKLALDQNPQDDFSGGEIKYAYTYYNKTPEYIFADLAIQAGWPLGTYHTEVSGITIAEFPVGHEAIADCYQRLCEITGFEWFADEIGDVYFRRARDPEAVKVYTFTEGVDIFSLNYTLNDEELYRNIVVYSNNSNRDTIKTTVLWPGADYNNVLPKKTLIVNAGELVIDQASCDAIAQNESNAITPKVREVNFVAVGNPYVQIGDVIQVVETSSHASEYYRILEIIHRINPTGKPVFATELRCYHFSYGE